MPKKKEGPQRGRKKPRKSVVHRNKEHVGRDKQILQNIIHLQQSHEHGLKRAYKRYNPLPQYRPRLDLPLGGGGGGGSSSAVAAPNFNIQFPPNPGFPALSANSALGLHDLSALREALRAEFAAHANPQPVAGGAVGGGAVVPNPAAQPPSPGMSAHSIHDIVSSQPMSIDDESEIRNAFANPVPTGMSVSGPTYHPSSDSFNEDSWSFMNDPENDSTPMGGVQYEGDNVPSMSNVAGASEKQSSPHPSPPS